MISSSRRFCGRRAENPADKLAVYLKKEFLRKLYADLYADLKPRGLANSGVIVEIGSGGGFIKDVMPTAVTSDIAPADGVDRVFPAERIPYAADSVDAFVLLNVFHHLSNPLKALREMSRCLKPGGTIAMTEPANTPFAAFVYKAFHHEYFDGNAPWPDETVGCPRENIALPWIMFVKDAARLKNEFRAMEISSHRCHTPFLYILSGGFSAPQLAPNAFYGSLKTVERILAPFNSLIGMFFTIKLRKKSSDAD